MAQNINFIISLVTISITLVCSFTILYSYGKLRLKPILLYFFGIFFIIFGTLGMIVGALPLTESFVKQFQSITFSISWLGIYFLYLAIKSSKGILFRYDTNLISGLTGAIITLYLTQSFYDVMWSDTLKVWTMQYHPIFMVLLSISMIFVVYELISFMRIIVMRTRHSKVKRNLKLFFFGWILLGFSGIVFGLSMVVSELPTNSFLIFFSSGLCIISIAIFLLPSSLIATPKKIYNIGFMQQDSGLILLFYDFKIGEAIKDPLLFSSLMSAINTSLTESVRGCRYLKDIDIGPRKILIERGYNTQSIMIAESKTPMLRSILKRLLLLFELKYFNVIVKDGANTEVYQEFIETIETYMAFAL